MLAPRGWVPDPLVDPGGSRANSFILTCIFTKKHPRQKLAPRKRHHPFRSKESAPHPTENPGPATETHLNHVQLAEQKIHLVLIALSRSVQISDVKDRLYERQKIASKLVFENILFRMYLFFKVLPQMQPRFANNALFQ